MLKKIICQVIFCGIILIFLLFNFLILVFNSLVVPFSALVFFPEYSPLFCLGDLPGLARPRGFLSFPAYLMPDKAKKSFASWKKLARNCYAYDDYWRYLGN